MTQMDMMNTDTSENLTHHNDQRHLRSIFGNLLVTHCIYNIKKLFGYLRT